MRSRHADRLDRRHQPFPNVKGIADKLLQDETVKSGKLKTWKSVSRDDTDERNFWQALVSDVFEQFVDAVASRAAYRNRSC